MPLRVFVTGVGVVSSIGLGRAAFFKALEEGVSGISPVAAFDAAALGRGLGGEVKAFDARDHLTQLCECRIARPAGREVRLERDALFVVELAVEILRQPVRPLIVHRSKCLRSAIRA